MVQDWQKGHKSHERISYEYQVQGQTIVVPECINLYSAHGSTIAALLAAFQVNMRMLHILSFCFALFWSLNIL